MLSGPVQAEEMPAGNHRDDVDAPTLLAVHDSVVPPNYLAERLVVQLGHHPSRTRTAFRRGIELGEPPLDLRQKHDPVDRILERGVARQSSQGLQDLLLRAGSAHAAPPRPVWRPLPVAVNVTKQIHLAP